MGKTSAGLLLFRFRDHRLELFLVHPGGPFWAKKDLGAWSIPKGEYGQGEDPFAVAKREFQEETGQTIDGDFRELNMVRQPGGKQVRAWAVQGDCDAERISSNTFMMEWPPKSGRQAEFPEVDRAGWFTVEQAREKILKGQVGFIDQLREMVSGEGQG
ncbi:DNA mismatch repair protein MutT [Geomonas sp. Red276]